MWIGVVQRPDAEGVRDLLPVVLQTDLQPGAGCRIVQVAKLSVERTTMAILPWLVPLLVALVVLTYVPSIALFLPRLAGL